MSETTKRCPKCGNTRLVLLSSQNEKRCTDCGAIIRWRRERGESVFIWAIQIQKLPTRGLLTARSGGALSATAMKTTWNASRGTAKKAMTVTSEPRVISWYSHGAASAVATKMALSKCRAEGRSVTIMTCEIEEEHPDNARFRQECEDWFDQEIVAVTNETYGGSIYKVFEIAGYIKGNGGAPCTKLLKKAVRRKHSRPDDVHVMGFTREEMGRVERFNDQNEGVALWPTLAEMRLGKQDCFQILNGAGIELPAMYKLGYKNNNCIGCVKGGQGYWNKIRVDFPDAFERMSCLEEKIGASINYTDIKKDKSASGKNEKRLIPLRELDPKAGRYSAEPVEDCGIFCGMHFGGV